NAFRVVCSNTIKGKNILLIDDVMTTGATVSECAKVLKKAGARKVKVITLYRVIKL
ncbi:MAG: phosphoribosyltransferase family protein, partial [Pseudomonadota bacterium]|nr:phosphoribosyltransferase family protein [Pseudomonadota bacterium]